MSGEVATRPKRQVVRYFPDSYYSMQADKETADIAALAGLPPSFKLYWLSLSRTNKWGHAPFMPGELARLLGGARATRRRALGTLIHSKIAAPESTMLCVVLSAELTRRADRATHVCIEPGHVDKQRCMWGPSFGWEDEPDTWQAIINDSDARERIIRRRTRTVTVTETVEIAEADD